MSIRSTCFFAIASFLSILAIGQKNDFSTNIQSNKSELKESKFRELYLSTDNLIKAWNLKSALAQLESCNYSDYSDLEQAKLEFLRARIYIGYDLNDAGHKIIEDIQPVFREYYDPSNDWHIILQSHLYQTGFIGNFISSKGFVDSLRSLIQNYPLTDNQYFLAKMKLQALSFCGKLEFDAGLWFDEKELLEFIEKQNNVFLTIEYYIHKADGHKRRGEYIESSYYLKNALIEFRRNQIWNTNLNAIYTRNLISYYEQLNQLSLALKSSYDELDFSEKASSPFCPNVVKANALANLSYSYMNVSEFESAFKYFDRLNEYLKICRSFRSNSKDANSVSTYDHLVESFVARLYFLQRKKKNAYDKIDEVVEQFELLAKSRMLESNIYIMRDWLTIKV